MFACAYCCASICKSSDPNGVLAHLAMLANASNANSKLQWNVMNKLEMLIGSLTFLVQSFVLLF